MSETLTVPEQWAGPTKRTPAEILAKVEEWADDDWLGTKRSDLLKQLGFEDARPYLKPEATAEDWPPPTADLWLEAEEYLDFAAGKIEAERGLSAERSVDHFTAWAWLMDTTGAGVEAMEAADYYPYGEPQVAAFAKHFGMRWPRDL